MPLSDRARQLLPQARLTHFQSWQAEIPAELLMRFQAAEDEQRFLSDADLVAIALACLPNANPTAARFLRDDAEELIAIARADLLDRFPGITEPGGGLYPEVRSQSCWRDCWQFLRCLSYGVAAGRADYATPAGFEALAVVYKELEVPIAAMQQAIETLLGVALKRFPPEVQAQLQPCCATLQTGIQAIATHHNRL
ncbi:phycobilisome protein [Synechococcus elongatus IITB7]|uniref:phycobilisome protein n=1 Tax=Synechococcus elongatus TaxID=32046 RepID=UPI0030D3282B